MEKCPATVTMEDAICVQTCNCELSKDHEGLHRTTYPGLDSYDPKPIFWREGETRIHVNRSGNRVR